MSAPKWTPAQRAAIEDRGGTLLVSAAAGSGKTAVLVERAVRLITDAAHPVAADRLLIVTFTRAAAEELRGRIAVRLAAEAAAHPESAYLRRQRLLLGRANICTIDAFCMQLLKRYFAELGLPPDFELADDAKAYTLRQNALSAVLEELYEDADFCAFASLYGRARSDASAAAAVLGLYDFSRTLPHPAAALQSICAAYESGQPLGQTAWGRTLLENAGRAARSALRLLDAAKGIVAQEPELANYAPALDSDAAFFAALLEYIGVGRWDSAAVYTAEYKPPAFKAVRGYQSPGMNAVKALRAAAKDAAERLRKDVFLCTEAEFEEDRARIAPMAAALARGAKAFGARLYEDKLAEKALEYSDFEHLALELLCGENGEKTAVARTVSRGFDAVLVDEYQDTNALQALLYQCLANDDGSNLFFVGDVKQSIYRFRLASPEIFIGKRGGFAPYTPGGPHPATVTLGHNFRSAGNIIDQINDVFACVMSRTVGDVDYNGDEMLVRGADDGYDGGPMELDIVDMSGGDIAMGDAGAVADAVERLVKEGFAVREKSGGTRRCGYGDICVLLRSRARFGLYAAEFARRGIPSFADTGESPLTSTEVSPVLSLLRVIDNPGQDVHLAAALVSVMFSFTPDDLTRLRLLAPRGSLYAALLKSEEPKAQAFLETLRALRRLAATASVEELCGEIFARTHYFAAVGAMENGPARRETLRAFTAWAAGVDRGGAGGLAAFLRVVDSAVESGAVQSGGTPVLPEGAVSIMTIHRSKGLEFPVVILADTARRFNLRDTSNPVLFHPSLGLGMNLRADGDGGLYSTVPHRAVRMAQRSEAVSEEMRILYVALTRARDKLIVTAPLQNPEKTLSALATTLAGTGGAEPYTLSQALSFSEWLCTAALLHPDCEELRKYAGGALLPVYAARGHMRARVVPAQPAGQAADEPSAFVRTARPDAALLEQLLQNFGARYENAPLCTLPAKLSVSGLVHEGAAPVLARPAFLYKEGLTAAERGMALHAALQFADLAAAANDLPGEVARLVEGGWLDAALAGQLELPRMAAFLQSPLAARMREAKKLLREYDFITAVPAKFVDDTLPEPFAHQPVLVQGIADAVLVNGDTAEIADYKTDRGKTPEQLLQAYAKQLLLYRAAVEKRLGVRVERCTIYSFSLGREIPIPLEAARGE